jgi:hypothetical protein
MNNDDNALINADYIEEEDYCEDLREHDYYLYITWLVLLAQAYIWVEVYLWLTK